jgi:hypothetical protein
MGSRKWRDPTTALAACSSDRPRADHGRPLSGPRGIRRPADIRPSSDADQRPARHARHRHPARAGQSVRHGPRYDALQQLSSKSHRHGNIGVMSGIGKHAIRDPRYSLAKWTKLAQYIRRRDPLCYVVDCPEPVRAADHIIPASLDMPDWQFFDPSNLRGSCRRHNTARGVAARLERETAQGVRPPPSRYSYGGTPAVKRGARGETRNGSGFLVGAAEADSPLPKSLSPVAYATISRDYSRRSPEHGDG